MEVLKLNVLRLVDCFKPSKWIEIDAKISAILGIILFFSPNFVARFILTGIVDGVHWHLLRCLGAQMLGMAYAWNVIKKTKNYESQSSCFITRITHLALTIMLTLNARSEHSEHFQNVLSGILVCCFCCLLINVYHLIASGWPFAKTINAPKGFEGEQKMAGCLVQFDGFAALVIGCAWMAFPEWILSRQVAVQLTGGHLFFGRCMGAIFASTQVLSTQCLFWQGLDDRCSWAFGRAIMCFGILSAQIWSQISYHDYWTGRHWFGITLFSIWSTIVFWFGINVKNRRFM